MSVVQVSYLSVLYWVIVLSALSVALLVESAPHASWPAFLAASGEACLALLDEGFYAFIFRWAVPLPVALLCCVLLLRRGGSANSSSKILPVDDPP